MKGRPIDIAKFNEFDKLCKWLEQQTELTSLQDLHEEMVKGAGNSDIYTKKWLKEKLKEKYGDDLFFAEMSGRSNVIVFTNNVGKILNNKWYEKRNDDLQKESERIIKTAAKLIIDDVKSTNFDCQVYPSNEDIASIAKGKEFLPKNLQLLMECLVPDSPVKQVSFGQSIIHALRPRTSLPPVLFALAVELEHVFGSKWLVVLLAKLGFSVSYDETVRYKQNVLSSENITNYINKNFPGSFRHWIADNVDHQVATLDGKGTLHAMGIIVASTLNQLQLCLQYHAQR